MHEIVRLTLLLLSWPDGTSTQHHWRKIRCRCGDIKSTSTDDYSKPMTFYVSISRILHHWNAVVLTHDCLVIGESVKLWYYPKQSLPVLKRCEVSPHVCKQSFLAFLDSYVFIVSEHGGTQIKGGYMLRYKRECPKFIKVWFYCVLSSYFIHFIRIIYLKKHTSFPNFPPLHDCRRISLHLYKGCFYKDLKL